MIIQGVAAYQDRLVIHGRRQRVYLTMCGYVASLTPQEARDLADAIHEDDDGYKAGPVKYLHRDGRRALQYLGRSFILLADGDEFAVVSALQEEAGR